MTLLRIYVRMAT